MPYRFLRPIRMITGWGLLCVNTSLFASPTLNTFMQEVWEKNPSIQAAEATLNVAKARQRAANQPIYNPELDIEAERSDINTMSIGISQSIDWADKRSVLSHASNAEIRYALAELNNQRFSLAKKILTTLTNIEATRQFQTLAQQRVELMMEFASNTEKRQQAGDVGLQDTALARVALSEAKMQLGRSKAKQVENEANIIAESGVQEWPMIAKEPPALSQSLDTDKYLTKLPSLNALKAALSASKSNIKLSKAQRKSDPTFGIKGGMEGSNALLGLSFSMPLNVRNNYGAEVEVANQASLQVEQLLLAETQRAKAHITGAHQRYRLTFNAWQSWKKTGLTSLKQQLDLIQTLWKSGEMSTADYLVQAKQNVDAQETAVELSAEMWAAWIEWLTTSGQIEQWINQSN